MKTNEEHENIAKNVINEFFKERTIINNTNKKYSVLEIEWIIYSNSDFKQDCISAISKLENKIGNNTLLQNNVNKKHDGYCMTGNLKGLYYVKRYNPKYKSTVFINIWEASTSKSSPSPRRSITLII